MPSVEPVFVQHRSSAELRQPEVDDLRHTVGSDHDIRRFNVPVDDAVLMGFGQTVGNLDGNDRLPRRSSAAPFDLLLKRLALVAEPCTMKIWPSAVSSIS